jgi:hypothetical protein
MLAIFPVTNAADNGTGSLREAINLVNSDTSDSSSNPDQISFGIPSSVLFPVQTIQPKSPLPPITNPVVLDGYSQVGAQANTLPNGDNAIFTMVLDGSMAGANADGLSIGGNSTVQGLTIQNFTRRGIEVQGLENKVQGNFVLANRIGVEVDGSLTTAASNLIGDVGDGANDPAERNLISGNSSDGVLIDSGLGNHISGNFIGTDANGNFSDTDVNRGVGVHLVGAAQNNFIGGAPARSNVVAFNFGGGVVVEGDASMGNSIEANSIHDNRTTGPGGNQALDIDLRNDGVTLNKPGGPHTGPNDLQNYPVISSAAPGAAGTTAVCTLNSTPLTTFTIDFYANSDPTPLFLGGGQRWLGFTRVTTDIQGNGKFAALPTPFGSPLAPSTAEEWITATATDPNNNTSEFSVARQLPLPPLHADGWVPIGPAPVLYGGVGRIDVAAPDPVNPNVMYVGADDGGIWKTTNWLDDVPIWTPLTDNPQILSQSILERCLAVALSDSNVVYAAASGPGGGILKSTDAGATWQFLDNSLFDEAEFGALLVDPNNPDLVYAAVNGGVVNGSSVAGGVYRSMDGGLSWFNITGANATANNHQGVVTDLITIQENGQTALYAGFTPADNGDGAGTSGIYKTTDGADDVPNNVIWQQLSLPIGMSIGPEIRLAAAGEGTTERVYATIFDSSVFPRRFVSIDQGSSWKSLSPLRFAEDAGSTPGDYPSHAIRHVQLVVDPNDPMTVFVNDFENTERSIDGGQTWVQDGGGDPTGGAFDLTGGFVSTGDNGLARMEPPTNATPSSSYGGKTGNLNTLQLFTFTLDPTDPQVAYATGQDYPGTLRYTGTQVWEYNPPYDGFESGKILVEPYDPTNPSDPSHRRIYYLDPGGSDVRFSYSIDGGQNWTGATTGLPTDASGNVIGYGTVGQRALAMDPTNPRRLALGLASVYLTTTGGDQTTDASGQLVNGWRDIGANLKNNGQEITAIAFAPSSPDTIYAGTWDGRIFRTDDASDTAPSWSEVDLGLPFTNQTVWAIRIDPANPNRVFAVTNPWVFRDDKPLNLGAFSHVWVTTDGVHWNSINGNLPNGNLPTELGAESLAVDWRWNSPVVYVGTQRGVYVTNDIDFQYFPDTDWTPVDSIPKTRVTDLDFLPDFDLLGAGTLGRGAYETLVDAPVPQLANISATTAVEGSVQLTVNGTNFVHDSVVEVNGVAVPTSFNSSGQLQATIADAEEGSLDIAVFTPGPEAGTSTTHLTLSVADATLAAAVVPLTVTEGAAFSSTVATFTDADPNGTPNDFSATITWGDGSSSAGTITSSGDGTFTVLGSHTYAEEASALTVSVNISDTGGAAASAAGPAAVADATFSANGTTIVATEGATFNGTVAVISDDNPNGTASDFSATIVWGDGSTATSGFIQPIGNQFYIFGGHTYVEEGSYSVSVTVNDMGSSSASAQSTASVVDPPLTAAGLTFSARPGATLANLVVATFVDQGGIGSETPTGDYSATIVWGDGGTSSGTVGAANASGVYSVSGSHTYSSGGQFGVTVTIRHDSVTPDAMATSSAVVGSSTPQPRADDFVLSQSTTSSGSGSTSVLANDISADGQPQSLRATLLAGASTSHGRLTLNAVGSFSYTPDTSFQGLDRFTYQVSENGTDGTSATVTLISYQASIVDKLYNQVLGRSAEDAGLQYWTGRIMAGATYGTVAEGIFESDERLNAIIAGGHLGSITYPGYYPQFLLRPADPAGLAYWKGVWKAVGGPDQVVSGMISSPEFYASAGRSRPDLSPNAAWVTALYERLLGREPDPAGLAYWTSNLDSQSFTREQVVLGFVESDENFRKLTTAFFQQYLNRSPTDTELTQYVDQFKAGGSQRDVQESIINLPEYANTPPAPAPGTVGKPLYPI